MAQIQFDTTTGESQRVRIGKDTIVFQYSEQTTGATNSAQATWRHLTVAHAYNGRPYGRTNPPIYFHSFDDAEQFLEAAQEAGLCPSNW